MTLKKIQTGFTMIELLVVTTIIIILSTIGLVSYRVTGQSARDSKRKADLETVRQALVLYRSDEGVYPSGLIGADYDTMTSTLVSEGYLSTPKPSDPKSDGVYVYVGTDDDFTLTATLEKDGPVTYEVKNP